MPVYGGAGDLERLLEEVQRMRESLRQLESNITAAVAAYQGRADGLGGGSMRIGGGDRIGGAGGGYPPPGGGGLIAGGGGGDIIVPTVGMIVNPDGSIRYDFEGHVKADGLDLDESTSATLPLDVNRLSWLDEIGREQSTVYGYGGPDSTGLTIIANRKHYRPNGFMFLRVDSGGAEPDSVGIHLQVQPTKSGAITMITPGPPSGPETVFRTLMNEKEESCFVQVPGVSAFRSVINAGTSTVTFPGGSPHANPKVIHHGLGAVPKAAIITPIGFPQSVATETYTKETFVAKMYTADHSSPPAGYTLPIAWLAIA